MSAPVALPAVPGDCMSRWAARLQHLAEDVEMGLGPRATATVLRQLTHDMRSAQRRARDLETP